MTTAYTSLLGLALPVEGELSGTWGDVVNDSITQLVEDSLAGTSTQSVTSGNWTLTTTGSGAPNQARSAILIATGTPGVSRNIIAPSQSKAYIVINQSNEVVVLKGSATTGVTIPVGSTFLCAWNGSDFVKVSENVAGSNTQVQFNNNGVFGASANLTWDGTYLTAGSIKDSALTNTRVTFAGASGLLTDSANLTFNGTTLTATGLSVTGNTTLGDADTDTITLTAQMVNGTQIKSAKSDTNTLSLSAYDVNDTTYRNLVTLTAGNTPTLTLTSTGTGTMDNITIGGSTRAAGSFTAVAANADSEFTSTGALKISSGTTAQRPGSPAVSMIRYNSTTNEFEGYSGSSPAWKSIGGSALSNDTTTTTDLYPTFAAATSGTAENLYTSDAKLLYKPSTGELKASALVASNGIIVNSSEVSADYTIATGTNGFSVGPITVASGVTVTVDADQQWVVI